ncbi:MAG: hypothetical protein PHI96_08185 [Desulfovibrio sp.]|nr:hypothetical protein [Desulfovibrio sp.]
MRSSCLVVLLAALMLLPGCAKKVAHPVPDVQHISIVPRPKRPVFPQFANGDFARLPVDVRTRLAQRHAMTVWYMKQLEALADAYEAQIPQEAAHAGSAAK